MAENKFEEEEKADKLKKRADGRSMLVMIASGFVGAGAAAVGAGYLADFFDAPRYVVYLSCAGGTIAGFFGGLYLEDNPFKKKIKNR